MDGGVVEDGGKMFSLPCALAVWGERSRSLLGIWIALRPNRVTKTNTPDPKNALSHDLSECNFNVDIDINLCLALLLRFRHLMRTQELDLLASLLSPSLSMQWRPALRP